MDNFTFVILYLLTHPMFKLPSADAVQNRQQISFPIPFLEYGTLNGIT
jgi:hypothetical protein